jgi:hypothetical protein
MRREHRAWDGVNGRTGLKNPNAYNEKRHGPLSDHATVVSDRTECPKVL